MPHTSKNSASPPVKSAVPLVELRGDDQEDTKLLQEMAAQAHRYVTSLPWCIEVHERYFGAGVGGIVALFLFRVTIRKVTRPEWIWVFVGDTPSAYLEVDSFLSPYAALLCYIEGVEEWLGAPGEERESGNLIPIEVPAGPEYVEMLRVRIETLRSLVLPYLSKD